MHVGSGDDKKVWYLPEKILKSQSTFFTAALEGGFAEGISKNVTLPDEDPDMFEYFVEWLYVGDDQAAAWEAEFLVPLWTLGDRLGCPLMQDDAMSSLIRCYNCSGHIEVDILKQIYEGSAPGSMIRRFAVDQCILDVRQRCPLRHENGCSYLQFVKTNEDFAQQLAEATILLGSGEPHDADCDESPYLCAPSSGQTPPKLGS